jgi:GT2 family glycosyltransferase
MKKIPAVFVHIVTWNSEESIRECIAHVLGQSQYTLGKNLFVHITDNASEDHTVEYIHECLQEGITYSQNKVNVGFSGGHNQGVEKFLQSECEVLLILNSDVGLSAEFLVSSVYRLSAQRKIGIVTPKLLRALPSLEPIYPFVLDACGMELTGACRHFDRGSGTWDNGQFDTGEIVFGATGACLLISKECISSVSLPKQLPNQDLFEIYPQLQEGYSTRVELFDEAFFAYREDADLSWRAQTLGWRCWYEPEAVGYHVRFVLPERRKSLPPGINMLGVRNRFLLQMNNWRFANGVWMLLWGIVVRNLIVLAGVLIQERSSMQGLLQARRLWPRSRHIRRWINERRTAL